MAANPDSPELGRNLYPFLSEVADMRRRARQHIHNGAIAPDRSANTGTVLRLLNEALATELVCAQRYRRHPSFANGTAAENVRGEFLKYAAEEQGHAEQLAQRIVQLGGEPNLQAPTSTDSPPAGNPEADSLEAEALADLLEEDMIAERITIESYREILQFLGDSDPTTRALLEAILAVESGHAEELAGMRAELLGRERAAIGSTSARLPALVLD